MGTLSIVTGASGVIVGIGVCVGVSVNVGRLVGTGVAEDIAVAVTAGEGVGNDFGDRLHPARLVVMQAVITSIKPDRIKLLV